MQNITQLAPAVFLLHRGSAADVRASLLQAAQPIEWQQMKQTDEAISQLPCLVSMAG